MYKLTTPTITFTLPDTVDMTTAEELYVTFATRQSRPIFEKTKDDLEITTNTVGVFLSQEETQQLTGEVVKVQLNWTYIDEEDNIKKRACSNIVDISVKENLKKEII